MLFRATSLMLLVSVCYSVHALAAEDSQCGYRTISQGTVFALTISRSFKPQVKFELCAREAPTQNFVLLSNEPHPGAKHWVVRKVPLNNIEYVELLRLYDLALGYDIRNDLMGVDGSIWCLETQRGGTYSKACFWTPTEETQKRKLVGLLSLGKDLWRLAALSPSDLY